MNLLITGATGFLGTNLVGFFENNRSNNIFTFSRVQLNSVSSDEMKNINVVIHLAGKAHDLKNVSDPHEYYNVNYGLTKKIFDAFLVSDASKFIFISSVKAAADTVESILAESRKADPKTHYGKSKLQAERYILGKELPDGKQVYILRPCMVHGPDNKGNLNLLYRFVDRGLPWPLGMFENKRSFLSISNFCFVIDELIKRDDIAGGIYNISDNGPLSTNELVQLMGNELNRKSVILKIPKKVIEFIAAVGSLLHLPFNLDNLKKLTENYIVSNTKLISALGKDLPLDSRKGMQLTIKSFKK